MTLERSTRWRRACTLFIGLPVSACALALFIALPAGLTADDRAGRVAATRLRQNPLITLRTSPSIGDNINGPTVIRVPSWVQRPLGRYYMYFAHHAGRFIRLAYADALEGPWTVHEPGVLRVEDTAFSRPQPDPVDSPSGAYTHVASPEIYVDGNRRRIVMWVHGMWTDGQRWPDNRVDAAAWIRRNGYGQFTQGADSGDGLRFEVRPAITRQSYLRVFQHERTFYGMARLGQLLRAKSPLERFDPGPDPFRETPFAGRVRHVALLEERQVLHVFFSAIGDAPETILHTTIALSGDWTQWRVGGVAEVLAPEAAYECPHLPIEPSAIGEIDRPARQLRDPAIVRDGGRTILFYTVCGEQAIAGAEIAVTP